MNMTLEEAIKHAEAVAIENEKEAKRKREHGGTFYDDEAQACSICAEQHRQLAEWLKELQERRKQPEIVKCKVCKYFKIIDYNELECVHPELRVYTTDFEFGCILGERRTDEQVQGL